MADRNCERCGVLFTPNVRERHKQKWCSNSCCQSAYRERSKPNVCPVCANPARRDAIYCSKPCAWSVTGGPANRRVQAAGRLASAARGRRRRRIFTAGPCPVCDVVFIALGLYQACSPGCSTLLRQRTRKPICKTKRLAIFERDGYRCGLCGQMTLRTRTVPHPRAPTVDHIIPQACGGTDDSANLQCACFECNYRKRDTVHGTGEQLRLVG